LRRFQIHTHHHSTFITNNYLHPTQIRTHAVFFRKRHLAFIDDNRSLLYSSHLFIFFLLILRRVAKSEVGCQGGRKPRVDDETKGGSAWTSSSVTHNRKRSYLVSS
jgi:hypothetical protein